MRRFAYIFAMVLSLASCRGYVDVSDPDYVPEGVLRIFADRSSIKADGQQTVTFTVRFGSRDVSSDQNMNLICIAGDNEKTLKPGVNVFTTTSPAEYRFKARYYSGSAHYTDNEVVVRADAVTEGVGQKDYYQKLWAMQFTAVSCTYCPLLTAALKEIMIEDPDRMVLTAFHVAFDEKVMPDPMRLDVNEDFRSIVKHGDGLPLFAFNMVKSQENIVSEKDKILSQKESILKNNPATCGVAVSADCDGTQVTVTGKVTSNVAEPLRYHIFLVEDGVSYPQMGAEDGYLHDNVVRAVLAENKWGNQLNSGLPVETGVEVEVSRTVKVSKDWNVENMRAVFAVISQAGDGFVCNNINECALGASSEYIYNE